MEDGSKEVSFGVWEEGYLTWRKRGMKSCLEFSRRNDILLGGWVEEVLGLKEGATMKAGR